MLCHGVCKRRRGKSLPLNRAYHELKTFCSLHVLDVLILSSCLLSAFLPPVKGQGVLRGAGKVLRCRDRVGSGLPACWKERGVSWSEGKLAESSSVSFYPFLSGFHLVLPPSSFLHWQAINRVCFHLQKLQHWRLYWSGSHRSVSRPQFRWTEAGFTHLLQVDGNNHQSTTLCCCMSAELSEAAVQAGTPCVLRGKRQ